MYDSYVFCANDLSIDTCWNLSLHMTMPCAYNFDGKSMTATVANM